MSTPVKRTYRSTFRQQQSQETKKRILDSAKKLFESAGFQNITIEEIAKHANISAASIFSIFKSKRGILLAVMDSVFYSKTEFDTLLKLAYDEKSPHKRFNIAARLSRQMFDAEKNGLKLLKTALIVDPEFKKLEMKREKRRYKIQQNAVRMMAKDNVFREDLSLEKIQDLLWMFTGRDIYRLLVIEQNWSSDEYERWLENHLIQALLKPVLNQ